MGKAKDILLKPIDAKTANNFVKRVHYSGKYYRNSTIHIGVYYRGNLEGVIQLGPSMNIRAMIPLVRNTKWNEFLELNRLAFTDVLPRNSESRAISIAMKLIGKYAPHVKWIVSFADGTQCGDGTIYRASGFILTQIKPNQSMVRMPGGEVVAKIVFGLKYGRDSKNNILVRYGKTPAESLSAFLKRVGAEVLPGFQLRYIYFLDPSYRERLTVPELPFSEIERMGAGMYKGIKRGRGEEVNAPGTNLETGGSNPTRPLLDMTGGEPELIDNLTS